MGIKCKRSNTVLDMQEIQKTNFGSFSRILAFIFTFWEVFNIYFDIHIIYCSLRAGETELMYVVIPTLIAITRPIVSVVSLLRRQHRLAKLFSDIITNLLYTFSFKKDKIQKIVQRIEISCGVLFVSVFISFTASRYVLAFVADKDIIYEKIFNVTNHSYPNPILITADVVMTHGCQLELLSAFLFGIYCALLRPMFDQDYYQLHEVNEEIISVIKLRFKIGFEMVQSVNDCFTAFLFLSFATQIFTICFWTRSIALNYNWTDARYHLWIMHFIIISLMSFIAQCWFAITLNQQVVSTVQCFTQQIGFIINEPVNVKFGEFLMLMNLQTNPPQITAWNAFAITKGFIITICGTVLTYTVALYGLQ
ncbi:hypothetical protein CHUAL_009943 [Chamberlinius hualienensis]